jgi:uncharacterized membrane protein
MKNTFIRITNQIITWAIIVIGFAVMLSGIIINIWFPNIFGELSQRLSIILVASMVGTIIICLGIFYGYKTRAFLHKYGN